MIKPKQLLVLIIALFVLSATPLAYAGTDKTRQRTKKSQSSNLTVSEKKVIDYLKKDWGKDYSVTSVDQAMVMVKITPTDESRFRIGSYIKKHPELHEVIRQWGWQTLVLNQDEKLIARAIINALRAKQSLPNEVEIAKSIGISVDDVKRGLDMLARYEILQRSSNNEITVPIRYQNWEPRLDFLFHTVKLSSGKQFNTN